MVVLGFFSELEAGMKKNILEIASSNKLLFSGFMTGNLLNNLENKNAEGGTRTRTI